MFNLYSAAKAIVDFQKEYELLFSEYSSLNEDFAKQELENILTLVNVWRYVLDNQPKGCAIAYDSKQKYATNSLKLWIESMKKLGEMKLYIQRYQQIVQTSIDEKCLCSMTAYTEMLIDQINTLWNDFILVEDLVSELIENANEQNSELLNVVKLFFNCYEELETVISTQNDPSELIQIIETVSIIMFLLLPSVS